MKAGVSVDLETPQLCLEENVDLVSRRLDPSWNLEPQEAILSFLPPIPIQVVQSRLLGTPVKTSFYSCTTDIDAKNRISLVANTMSEFEHPQSFSAAFKKSSQNVNVT